MSDQGEEAVGSLGQEAARLLEVLAGWAATAPGGFDHQPERRPSDEPEQTDHPEQSDHPAHPPDAADVTCRFCPICRGAHALRDAAPEVRVHLAAAAASLMQAAAGVLAAAAAEHARPSGQAPRSGVQRIDLDADTATDRHNDHVRDVDSNERQS